jgi:hypothetical protein
MFTITKRQAYLTEDVHMQSGSAFMRIWKRDFQRIQDRHQTQCNHNMRSLEFGVCAKALPRDKADGYLR